jgi:hypothetical protein
MRLAAWDCGINFNSFKETVILPGLRWIYSSNERRRELVPLKSSRRSFPFLVYTSPSVAHGIYVGRSSFCRWRFGADAAGECLLLMTCSLMTRNLIICSLLLFALPANHVGEC